MTGQCVSAPLESDAYGQAHAALARFAIRNRAALQIAATLSGGERLRAGLACVLARPQPPFLLLLTSRPTISISRPSRNWKMRCEDSTAR
jgi:ABC-type thiamine transport system ATPase subunit